MSEKNRHIVLASGGTGGHIFPARALAEELIGRNFRVTLLTDSRGETYEDLFPGVDVVQIRAGSPSVGGLFGKIKAVFELSAGTLQSLFLLRKEKPIAVVGFGGYPSMPPAAAATLLGVPLVLHEQNAILGRVNNLLAGRAAAIATSFMHTDANENTALVKMRFTGNPVRKEILSLHGEGYCPATNSEKFNLLVLGGSQGATILSDVVPAAIKLLPLELQRRLHVTQQCRKEDLAQVEKMYETAAITSTLATFFDNIPELLASCHLAIARSGASTMAELAVAGRPAILVPYKFAMDNHQFQNAKNSVDRGAAELILQDNFTVETLKEKLLCMLSHPEKLKTMATATAQCAEVEAAENLADMVEEMAKKRTGGSQMNGKVAA
ncbi:undecaprenyldiphospho-muramoylpentapeptide beta-N-acetylglucosaminyltransferase [Alphaproteobacteria bacterium 46_93_T64]|nr:undecaprenyldiphospho-muramoylpentapeptide beta-N-acetylglucosaminyltransferase [Alphaproteobacteria bacterium 46_93_T64]